MKSRISEREAIWETEETKEISVCAWGGVEGTHKKVEVEK